MDRLIYSVMSAAERTLRAEQVHANNLANSGTSGFQSDLETAKSQAVTRGYGYGARHMSRMAANAIDGRVGAASETGRDLDIAISESGYLAVQDGNGEAYTRAGSLSVDADGALSVSGHAVLGDGGPIVLPTYTSVAIDTDGTLSIRSPGQSQMQPVDRLKLVKASASALVKNAEGLIVTRSGQTLPADPSVQVRSEHLEGSNVSPVDEMISTMSLSRDFEIQMKLYSAADNMAAIGNKLVGE